MLLIFVCDQNAGSIIGKSGANMKRLRSAVSERVKHINIMHSHES